MTPLEKAARDKAISDCLAIVAFGRERGERDLRQIRNWIECLKTGTLEEFMERMNEAT